MKGQRKRRGGKPKSTQPERKVEQEYEDIPVKKGDRRTDNDWRWYAQTPELVKAYASYPFGYPLGSTVPFVNQEYTNARTAVPGYMAVYFHPTVGISNEENAPMNIAMRNIYTFVRHANSGHSNYDAPDLMLYLLAMDSLYMMHAFMTRAHNLLPVTSPFNRYYAKGIFEAMGLDYDDFVANYADFNGFINLFTTKIGKLCVPASMSYMARHSWMCQNFYADSNTEKAQTYFYTPASYLSFELNAEGAGSLVYKQLVDMTAWSKGLKPQLLTFASLMLAMNNLANQVLANEDMNIMSGDILKAYGEGGVVRLAGVPLGQMVLPVYNQEVLSQIENSVAVGRPNSGVTQNTSVGGGYLVFNPKVTRTYPAYVMTTATGTTYFNLAGTGRGNNRLSQSSSATHILNFHHSGVTPEETMVATRLIARTNMDNTAPSFAYNPASGNVGAYCVVETQLTACGSEIVDSFIIGTYNVRTGNYDQQQLYSDMLHFGPSDSSFLPVAVATDFAIKAMQLSVFDWHPIMHAAFVTPQAATTADIVLLNGVLGDVDYYALLDFENVRNMHETALLSEFVV